MSGVTSSVSSGVSSGFWSSVWGGHWSGDGSGVRSLGEDVSCFERNIFLRQLSRFLSGRQQTIRGGSDEVSYVHWGREGRWRRGETRRRG